LTPEPSQEAQKPRGNDPWGEVLAHRQAMAANRLTHTAALAFPYVHEYSDTLLKFLLEAKRPAVYRARNINVMALDGGDGVLEVRWLEPESPQEQQPSDR